MSRRRLVAIATLGGIGTICAILASILFYPVEDTIVIVPSYTKAAYQPGGFYSYYNGKCDEKCLIVSLTYPPSITSDLMKFSASKNGISTLKWLGFKHFTDDTEVSNNPRLLGQYKHVIVLHNEYVTQAEFDAITSHPSVLYLYPNALYAQVKPNEDMITLVDGHNYRNATGFSWPYSQVTKDEYDIDCHGWYLKDIPGNGKIMSCYPENDILYDPVLWWSVKQYAS